MSQLVLVNANIEHVIEVVPDSLIDFVAQASEIVILLLDEDADEGTQVPGLQHALLLDVELLYDRIQAVMKITFLAWVCSL